MSYRNTKFSEKNYHEYSYSVFRRRRCKTDWAGNSIGNSFRQNMDFQRKRKAQRLFYKKVKEAQLAAASAAGVMDISNYVVRIKPQISPCYTSYPRTPAAYAAIGLTAFLEFQDLVGEKLLLTTMKEFLENPCRYIKMDVDCESLKYLVGIVAQSVQTRLLLEDLSRHQSLTTIEIFRIFAASQQSFQFNTLSEIVNAVILYGEILPDLESQPLHPMTLELLKVTTAASAPFLGKLLKVESGSLVQNGEKWVRKLTKMLAEYLPASDKKDDLDIPTFMRHGTQPKFRFERNTPGDLKDQIAPLAGPQPPSLYDPASIAEDMLRKIFSEPKLFLTKKMLEELEDDPFFKAFKRFAESIEQAGEQSNTWEDIRNDLLERNFGVSAFKKGPLEGSPSDGHQISVDLGEDALNEGEIFDKTVEFSENVLETEKLIFKAEPLSELMKRSLYPNIAQIPKTQRIRTSGSLDDNRLSSIFFSDAVYKRYPIKEQADRRGRPLLVIAADGSGSLDINQMEMLKLLTTAWMISTRRSKIQVLAGLYHSGTIRSGVAGPLVQWIHHPVKTAASDVKDTVGAIASLPHSGTGTQSDALSIAFILQEAKRLARGNMIYLILLTDCVWNRSFHSEKSGLEEVHSLLETFYDDFSGKLHTTLVALGSKGETQFEDILDKVICISTEELKSPTQVAKKIGTYVASCIHERNKIISRANSN